VLHPPPLLGGGSDQDIKMMKFVIEQALALWSSPRFQELLLPPRPCPEWSRLTPGPATAEPDPAGSMRED